VRYRRVVVRRTGGPEVLELVEDEIPEPDVGQARVKIIAADVSFSDVNIRRGRYPGAPRPPFTPGYAMVGLVDRLGPQATSVAIGQAVAALTFYGSYSEYICLPTEELVPIPPGVDPAEAVTLVVSYVAAYQMLHRIAHVTAGQKILVHGAAGGVGSAFLELGALAALTMYGTASAAKHPLVARLGATPIDYRAEDFVERIVSVTTGAGVDAAFDPMGSNHLRQSARAVRKGGIVVAYGYYEAANRHGNVVVDVLKQYLQMLFLSLPPGRKRSAFYDIRGQKKKRSRWFKSDLAELLDQLAKGRLKPVIAARIPLEEVIRAHQQLEEAQVQGKLVLMPDPTRC
jgi:NADPH:quinone reductase